MDKNKLRDFKESELTKDFFEVLRKKREILKEDVVSGYETGRSISRDDIANDIMYINGYSQCLQDVVNINQEVINDIITQHREKIRFISGSDSGSDNGRPDDLSETDKNAKQNF